MNNNNFWDWIKSLNPIEIQVDDEGNCCPEDLEKLTERLTSEIEQIRSEKPQQDGEQVDA